MKYGIMQGRLTEKKEFYPQQFPWANWENEFFKAKAIGASSIEWMFNSDCYTENPIWTDDGRKRILRIINSSGTTVDSICANIFMDRQLWSNDSVDLGTKLIDNAITIGAEILIFPLFNKSEPNTANEMQCLFNSLQAFVRVASMKGILIAIETDLELKVIIGFVNSIKGLKICYDVGNATGLGKNASDEILTLKEYIGHIHIKDKKVGGSSVMLGEGDVNFMDIGNAIKAIDYSGNLILESFYGKEVVESTIKNLNYLREALA